MFDFSKLNENPWCGCCDNSHTMRVAEEILDNVIQKHYTKPMCIGSIHQAVEIAAMMMLQVTSGITVQKLRDRNPLAATLPFSTMRAMAGRNTMDAMDSIQGDIADFFNKHDPKGKWEIEFLQKMHAAQEVAKADEAFQKQAKED